MPADDCLRTHNYDGVLPIEKTGEKREATTPRSIDAPRLDSALDVLGELFSKHQVLGTNRDGRAREQQDEPEGIRKQSHRNSNQTDHVLIMP